MTIGNLTQWATWYALLISVLSYSSAHTVSGHEAAHLAKKLSAELAAQQENQKNPQSRPESYGTHIRRANSPDPEPRSRSYEQRADSTQRDGKSMYTEFDTYTLLFVVYFESLH